MTRLTLLLAFVAAVLSYDNGEATVRAVVRLGGITISYNPAHWRHGDTENPPILAAGKTKGASLRYFVCIAPECRGDPFVWASARLVADSALDEVRTRPDAWHAGSRPLDGLPSAGRDFGGLILTGRILLSGCRARTPVERYAAGSNGAFAYSFGTGANLGCSGVEGAPEGMFLELLEGISVDAKAHP